MLGRRFNIGYNNVHEHTYVSQIALDFLILMKTKDIYQNMEFEDFLVDEIEMD